MILLADSGSTKTDWGIVENGTLVKKIRTRGMNPFQMSEDEIAEEIRTTLVPELPSQDIAHVYFYGAGCTPEKQPVVERAIRKNLNITGVCEVASDMLAAARGVCGHESGIACILGTGFILGDEGSGAVLGKLLVGDVLKNQMPKAIADRFFEKFKLTNAEIIDRVYRQPKPNTFLASFVPFLAENISEPCIYNLVKEGFRSFLRRNVKQYDGWDKLPIGFNGSIAKVFREPLEEALKDEGMHLGRIVQAPMEGLVEYHRA